MNEIQQNQGAGDTSRVPLWQKSWLGGEHPGCDIGEREDTPEGGSVFIRGRCQARHIIRHVY